METLRSMRSGADHEGIHGTRGPGRWRRLQIVAKQLEAEQLADLGGGAGSLPVRGFRGEARLLIKIGLEHVAHDRRRKLAMFAMVVQRYNDDFRCVAGSEANKP